MINVFDIGARYGVHPTWSKLFKRDLVYYHAFEIDQIEVERLRQKYLSHKNFTINNIGFSDKKETLNMNILEHKGQSSFLSPNLDSNWFKVHRILEAKIRERVEYSLTTLHEYTSRTKKFPDFIKIDTEGMDLKVLKGSSESMLENVLGISCEVYFEEVFENSPLFGEIDSFLVDHGFKIANIAYDGRGIPSSYFCPNPNKFGFISGCEAIYVKQFEKLDGLSKVKLALFCFSNRLEDYAYLILKNIMTTEIHSLKDDDLWLELKREFALCTKRLMYQPGDSYSIAKTDFEHIFKSKFPEMHNFFEDNEINPA